MDLIERLSYISSSVDVASKPVGASEYADVKTPTSIADDCEGGALRAGGAPQLWSKDYIGLLAQYTAVGMLLGTLPGTIYPFLLNYLNMEGTQIISAKVLLTMPWSFKVLYGILSDCVPIGGYRRRPFMILGWCMSTVMLLTMGCMDAGGPYYGKRYLVHKPHSLWTDQEKNLINHHAPDRGGTFIVLMMLAAVGYVGADVAADGVVVELAQREPEVVRGKTQTTIYLVRTIFVTLSNVLTGLAFNGEDYGGQFTFSLTFPQLMLVLAAFCIPVIPITWCFIREDKHPGIPFRRYLAQLWELLQQRVMYQVIAYKFFSGLFENFSATCADPIQELWAKATPLNDKIFGMVGSGIFALTLFCTGKYGLAWNWRWMHATTLVLVTAVDMLVVLLTTWDIVRSQWFWLGTPILEQVPAGIGFIISTYVVVEIAGQGNESAVYGLLTTVSNLSIPFATALTKNVDGLFDVTNADIKADTTHVRWHVTIVMLLRYSINLLGLLWLPLLPAQKAETQTLKAVGGTSRMLGILTVTYVGLALMWSVTVNILSIYPQTKCLRLVGGKGCRHA